MSETEKCERILYLKECSAQALSLSGLTAVIKRYYHRLRRGAGLKGGGGAVTAQSYSQPYMYVQPGVFEVWHRGVRSDPALSSGRIIYGSFAAFLPGMTSRLQDVASAVTQF